MLTAEKKKRIQSLSTEEMLFEINLGRRSRFQRDAFAYLQTCYQQRLAKKNKTLQTTAIKVTGKDNVFVNIGIEGFDKGIDLSETAERNKFFNTDIISSPSQPFSQPQKKWYERPFGIVLLMVIAGLIVGFLIYYFGWR